MSSSDNDDDDDSDNEDDLNVSQNEIQDITADTADTKLQLNTKTVEQAQKPEQVKQKLSKICVLELSFKEHVTALKEKISRNQFFDA